ncbi:aldo/keto reductase [Enterococcus hermanniensis]|uniref:NADP-dependent oxidoreductase domain-containing protein n=1 Tax=Enterococcus hermanniensis TaxID=249189 RepID=A0A1L8TCK1_9ENTE|nr:aldo/keto reductase [Enterococcus hermanniensis]OJG41986.1 hypothetical protein RV04_GL001145 [Enterococcus hermanniensis]
MIKIGEKRVPIVGLGSWHMGEDSHLRNQEIESIQAGIKLGATVIDTAEMYGEGKSELMLGEAIAQLDRESLYLISKVYPWNASKEQLPISLDRSLKRLGIDYIDLYLLHWRGSIPLAETVEALEHAKQVGKIRAWGVSNFDVADLEELYALPNGQYCAANEVLYNLGSRNIEYDLLPWMQEHALPLIAYSPIAQGDSLGNDFQKQESLKKIAKNHQATVFQILLAWTLRNNQTLAIPQSSNPNHVKENIVAAKIRLTENELAQIDKIYPKPTKKQPLAML